MLVERQMALLRRYVTASAIALFAFLLLLVTCNLNVALASSGGVMGGSFFDSDSESSSSESHTRDSELYRTVHHHYNDAPSPDTELAKGSHGGLMFFLIFVLGMFLVAFYTDTKGNSVTVIKFQVAMLSGTGSSIQRDLIRIAETADTSSKDGVSYLLIETIQSLVRQLRYCVAGYSFVDLNRRKEDGEKQYNQLSNEERAKFDEETLVNLNNREKRSTRTQSDVFDVKDMKEGRKIFEEEKLLNGFGNEYIVITILVAAKGEHKLPNINGAEDLKIALQKLRTLPSNKLLAGKVLWTPQNEDDTLSKQKLLEDYPQLAKGMASFLVKKQE